MRRKSAIEGNVEVSRIPLLGFGRPTLPFLHPWNFREPLRILDSVFWGLDHRAGVGRHNRVLEVPGFPLVFVTREPAVILAVLHATGDKIGQFDRDTTPLTGVARATGEDTLLYSNGSTWRGQKKLSAPPFGPASLFQPEKFHEFEVTFRKTIAERLEVLRTVQEARGEHVTRAALEPEIGPVMLEMLVNNFFGGEVPYEEIRNRYVPAITTLVPHMIHEAVAPRLCALADAMTGRTPRLRRAAADFEALTDAALAGRTEGRGQWGQFKSEAPDAALRSNIRVFLAGALEATTSFAAWALSHLSRAPEIQERVYESVKNVETYDPENLAEAVMLNRVLEETLRLTPSLYFLPRRAVVDTRVEIADGRRLFLPAGTHVVLDVWHANRCEDFWGEQTTGYPADSFAPDRWEHLARAGRTTKETLHFGFGFGPRICPGKFLGLLEVGLVVGAMVKVFRFRAVHDHVDARSGASTKPRDAVLVDLERR